MSGLALLMGLLVLAYAGSFIVAAHPGRRLGSTSGIELVVLGVALGPEALGVIGPDALATLAPVAHIALGWVGLILGVEARASLRRGTAGAFLRGFGLALATALAVAAPLFALLSGFGRLGVQTSLVLAIGGGVASAGVLPAPPAVEGEEATHDARASGADLACIAMLVLVSTLASWRGAPTLAWSLGVAGPTVGVLLGLTAAALVGKEPRDDAIWGVLLGVSMLAIGVAARLSLHAIAIAFAIGAMLAVASPARSQVRALVAPTARPVQLPTLVLAGASVDPHALASTRLLVSVASVALAARLLVRVLAARGARRTEERAAAYGTPPLGVFVGLSIALASPRAQDLDEASHLGALPLLIAALAALFGELARARMRAAAVPSASGRPQTKEASP